MSPFRRQKIYIQKYRPKWERMNEFKGWLKPLPGNITKAYCSVCHVIIKAHLCDLRKHGAAKKHRNATRLVKTLKSLSEGNSVGVVAGDPKVIESNLNSEEEDFDSDEDNASYRWPNNAVECLIKHLKAYWKDFRDGLRKKKDIWEDISQAMSRDGFNISSYECGKKFRNIKFRYFNVLEKYLTGESQNIRISYFDDLHELMSKDPETAAYLEQRKLSQKSLALTTEQSDEGTIVFGESTSGFDMTEGEMEWTESATHLMLDFLLEFKDFFTGKETDNDDTVWQTIAEQMHLEGYEVDEAQCLSKWKGLVQQYVHFRSVTDSTGTVPLWPYYTRVRHVVNTVSIPMKDETSLKVAKSKRGRGRGRKRTFSEQNGDAEVESVGTGGDEDYNSPRREERDRDDDEQNAQTLDRIRRLSETAALWQRLNSVETRLDELSDHQEVQRHTNSLLSQILAELSALSNHVSPPRELADSIRLRDGITIVVPSSEQ